MVFQEELHSENVNYSQQDEIHAITISVKTAKEIGYRKSKHRMI